MSMGRRRIEKMCSECLRSLKRRMGGADSCWTYWIAEAWTWINKCPSCTSGLGTSSRVRTGGLEGSGRVRTRAFIVDILAFDVTVLAKIDESLLLSVIGRCLLTLRCSDRIARRLLKFETLSTE